jgi:hypothetical protein
LEFFGNFYYFFTFHNIVDLLQNFDISIFIYVSGDDNGQFSLVGSADVTAILAKPLGGQDVANCLECGGKGQQGRNPWPCP